MHFTPVIVCGDVVGYSQKLYVAETTTIQDIWDEKVTMLNSILMKFSLLIIVNMHVYLGPAVKPAVLLLQIQEVHPGPHSNACNFCRFYLFFHTCSI